MAKSIFSISQSENTCRHTKFNSLSNHYFPRKVYSFWSTQKVGGSYLYLIVFAVLLIHGSPDQDSLDNQKRYWEAGKQGIYSCMLPSIKDSLLFSGELLFEL